MKKNIFLIALFLVSLYTNSQQKKINNYKYIIVADKFEFLKKPNKYQTSSLTKFLLKKNGFDVYLNSEESPLEVKTNRCAVLFADVVSNSNLLKTKLKIRLKDCFGKVVYISKAGESREKEYKKSYQEALRNAHSYMSDIQYVALPESKEMYKKDMGKKVSKEVSLEKKKLLEPTKVVANAVVIKNKESVVKTAKTNIKTLYSQPNKNGFQLINTKPEVIFLLLNTNIKDVFVIKGKNGILYKKGNIWVAEYYKNESLVSEEYQIKF